MFRFSPVLGLRPVRAGRLLVPKVPKPTTRASSPLARASPIASNTASTASPAADLAIRSGRPHGPQSPTCSPVLSLRCRVLRTPGSPDGP